MAQMNFEYTIEELNNFSLEDLQNIADKYNLQISNNKEDLIKRIRAHQDKLDEQPRYVPIAAPSLKELERLPDDLLRLTLYNYPYFDILDICHRSEKIMNLCEDESFWRSYLFNREWSPDEYDGNWRYTVELYATLLWNKDYPEDRAKGTYLSSIEWILLDSPYDARIYDEEIGEHRLLTEDEQHRIIFRSPIRIIYRRYGRLTAEKKPGHQSIDHNDDR